MNKFDPTKRNFIKNSLFTAAGILATQVDTVNSLISDETIDINFAAPKRSMSHGLYALTFGTVFGSKDFPMRKQNVNPRNIITTDGTLIWFAYPSERGDARGYVRPHEATNIENLDLICHRVRMGRPDPPYYLYWMNGDYYLYKTPGSILKRASYLLRNKADEPESILVAMSDFRFSALINSVFLEKEKAEEILIKIAEIDKTIRRRGEFNIDYDIQQYKKVLTESNCFC